MLIWVDHIMQSSQRHHAITWTCTSQILQWSTQLSQRHQSHHAIVSYDPTHRIFTKHMVHAISQLSGMLSKIRSFRPISFLLS